MDIELFPPIPRETADTALLVLDSDNFYLAVGEKVNDLFSNFELEDHYPGSLEPRRSQALFFLISIFQFMEVLSDSQVAEAIKSRVDWKYALHLPLCYGDLSASDMCEFRHWMAHDRSRQDKLYGLVARLSTIDKVASKPHLLKLIQGGFNLFCLQTRLSIVWGVVHQLLRELAASQPEWLRSVYQPHWYQRYSHFPPAANLEVSAEALAELALAIGVDGFYLEEAIASANIPALEALPGVRSLYSIWRIQYRRLEGRVVWVSESCCVCSS